jgi:hypothetical protein
LHAERGAVGDGLLVRGRRVGVVDQKDRLALQVVRLDDVARRERVGDRYGDVVHRDAGERPGGEGGAIGDRGADDGHVQPPGADGVEGAKRRQRVGPHRRVRLPGAERTNEPEGAELAAVAVADRDGRVVRVVVVPCGALEALGRGEQGAGLDQ